MVGTFEVFRKELADNLGSKRFFILFFIIYLLGLSLGYGAIQDIKNELQRTGGESVFLTLFTGSSGPIPPFLVFLAFFAPLISFTLTFDSINREESSGTLGMILSQPVHRDSLIIGKYAAGIATISLTLTGIVLLVTGMSVISLSVLPSIEEILRICAFLGVSIAYLCLWVALGLLFSIFFKRESTSALASIATWLFFIFFIFIIADFTRGAGISPDIVRRLSPSFLYTQAASIILNPKMRVLSPVSYEKLVGMLPNPLPLEQSLLLVWPHITCLVATMLMIFIITYVKFMRQEVRPP